MLPPMLVLSTFETAYEVYEDKLFIWFKIANKYKIRKLKKKDIKLSMPFIKCILRIET